MPRVGPCRRSRSSDGRRRLDDAADGARRGRRRPAADPRRGRRVQAPTVVFALARPRAVGARRRRRARVAVAVLRARRSCRRRPHRRRRRQPRRHVPADAGRSCTSCWRRRAWLPPRSSPRPGSPALVELTIDEGLDRRLRDRLLRRRLGISRMSGAAAAPPGGAHRAGRGRCATPRSQRLAADRAGPHRPRGPRRRRPLADRRDAQPHRRPPRPGDAIRPAPTRRCARAEVVGRDSLDSIRQVMGLLREPDVAAAPAAARPGRRAPTSSTATGPPASTSTLTMPTCRRRSTRRSSSSSTASSRSRWRTCCSTRRARRPTSCWPTTGDGVDGHGAQRPGTGRRAPPRTDAAGLGTRGHGRAGARRRRHVRRRCRPAPAAGWFGVAARGAAPRRRRRDAWLSDRGGRPAAARRARRRPAARAGRDRVHPVDRARHRGRVGGRQRRARRSSPSPTTAPTSC